MLSIVRSSLNLLKNQSNVKILTLGANYCSSNDKPTENSEINVNYLGEDHERIAIVEMNRPEAKNALNFSMIENLSQAIELLATDGQSRVVILRSIVPGVFCAGADLIERAGLTAQQFAEYGPTLRQLMIDIENLPMPVISAIDGAALGGGLELALSCDFRTVCSSAKVGLVETKWGIIPGAGGTQRLPRLIPTSIAKELIYSAEVLDGEEAHLMGICNHCVQQNSSGDAAYQKALEIAVKITKRGPIAVRMAKLAINKGMEVDLNNGLLIEEACYAQTTKTEDRIEGLKAFAEKREPKFTGN